MSSEITLSLNAVFESIRALQTALERGGFVGGDHLTNLDNTNLVTNPSNQDPTNPPLQTPSRKFRPILPWTTMGREVFEHWKLVMGKTERVVFDRKRERAVGIQLKLGRSVADLKRAIDGCKLDPFSMGENDRAQMFNDFCLIFRDAAHVEKFMAIADAPNARLLNTADPAKLRADAAAERRKQETRRLLERQSQQGTQIDPAATKQRLAYLLGKIGKAVD